MRKYFELLQSKLRLSLNRFFRAFSKRNIWRNIVAFLFSVYFPCHFTFSWLKIFQTFNEVTSFCRLSQSTRNYYGLHVCERDIWGKQLSYINKTAFRRVLIEMKQRFTGTQYASLFTITSSTVVRDGLGTNQKLGARNVSIVLSYGYCSWRPS